MVVTVVTNLKRTSRILVVGESGSGKTYLSKKIIANFPRHIIICPYVGEYAPDKNVIYTTSKRQAYNTINKVMEKRGIFLLIDDADLFLEQRIDDDDLMRFVAGSRHFDVGYIIITRRTTDVPKLFFKQCNKIALFQTDLANDLKVIRDNFGEEAEQKVRALNRANYEFLWIDREARTMEVMRV